MPSALHEILIEMFRHRPGWAAELLTGLFAWPVPEFQQARLEAGDFSDLVATEYRADAVVVLLADDAPVLAVVVEAQLRRDPDKRWSWPVYLTTLRARLRCPVVLLVVCVDAAIAAWSAASIELGHPGARVTPLVLGPERMPLMTDAGQAARHPQTAVLSALAHAADPPPHAVLDALMAAFAAVDEQHAGLYTDVVLAALPLVARRYLEELMSAGTYEYQSDFARRYFHQGQTRGQTEAMAAAVLAVLAARSVDVPNEAAARITDCTDREQLDCWLRRAATAHTVAELFG